MKGICNGCGKETIVSMCESRYDEAGELVDPGGWLCGDCHHGGPKDPTEIAMKEVQGPSEILAVEDEAASA